MDMALARSKISNRMVAQRLGVDETTIRRWRKENIEFERAFTEAREALREK
jgi:transposase-like protein